MAVPHLRGHHARSAGSGHDLRGVLLCQRRAQNVLRLPDAAEHGRRRRADDVLRRADDRAHARRAAGHPEGADRGRPRHRPDVPANLFQHPAAAGGGADDPAVDQLRHRDDQGVDAAGHDRRAGSAAGHAPDRRQIRRGAGVLPDHRRVLLCHQHAH